MAACILVKLFMDRTALGYEIRAVGLNPDAAETAGISKAKVTIVALCISESHRGPGQRQPCAGRGPPPDQRLLQRLRLLRHLRGRPGGGQPRGRYLRRHRVRRSCGRAPWSSTAPPAFRWSSSTSSRPWWSFWWPPRCW
ncbi:MAG: ABC transporter permease subunit [Flavonifractor plautii]